MATFYESLPPKIEGFKKSGAIALLFSWHKFGKQRSCLLFPLPPVVVPDERLVRDFGCRIKGDPFRLGCIRCGMAARCCFPLPNECRAGFPLPLAESVYLNTAGTIRYNKGE